MMEKDKKIIVFKSDINKEKIKGELCYVKFIDKNEIYAVFYKPLIAPKYFKHYLKENKIKEAFVLKSDEEIEKYKDALYTFESENGVYHCKKGVIEEKRYLLLVDKGMEIKLDAPKYFYEIKNDRIIISDYKDTKNKGYCYVFDDENVNEHLKNTMIETSEIIPGILYMGNYNIDPKVKIISNMN